MGSTDDPIRLAAPSSLTREEDGAIRRLHGLYWARTDARDDGPPQDLFCEAAVFTLGNLTLSGKAEIAAFFRQRQSMQEASGRTTRHLSAELMISPLSDGRVATRSTVLAMAGSGPLPIAATPPSVADFEDICVRQANGAWLFERRSAVSIFAGPQAPRFAQTAAPPPLTAKADEP